MKLPHRLFGEKATAVVKHTWSSKGEKRGGRGGRNTSSGSPGVFASFEIWNEESDKMEEVSKVIYTDQVTDYKKGDLIEIRHYGDFICLEEDLNYGSSFLFGLLFVIPIALLMGMLCLDAIFNGNPLNAIGKFLSKRLKVKVDVHEG